MEQADPDADDPQGGQVGDEAAADGQDEANEEAPASESSEGSAADAEPDKPESEAGSESNSNSGNPGQGEAGVASNAGDGKDEERPAYNTGDSVEAIAEPSAPDALINKHNKLPADYAPDDLVYPDVPFIFGEYIDKRMLRKDAAAALERMFAAAKDDGVALAGVSGYRSYARQQELFDAYVERDGEAAARTYSAEPGTSEHQSGLAMDISGTDGACAASSCFAGTPEAEWIAEHADAYGFIVRYGEDEQAITGYKYEPWHVRYVGESIAAEVAERGITLEEYYDAVPVSAGGQ
ncbi:D-alanyl-D-alanine carboxypeptidase family protein [Paenibacillus sp. IB182496]|uniref:D-alanyl-D-alanine carboxypeptidase family protein n=2 Tax=Paenibacillus sabuli TaxID=2772509 RepID=A0A927BS62_9BACL|nr:D-alanyl-D-alanine carboxypeptidase family protein [Paenibacillus sabuli]